MQTWELSLKIRQILVFVNQKLRPQLFLNSYTPSPCLWLSELLETQADLLYEDCSTLFVFYKGRLKTGMVLFSHFPGPSSLAYLILIFCYLTQNINNSLYSSFHLSSLGPKDVKCYYKEPFWIEYHRIT